MSRPLSLLLRFLAITAFGVFALAMIGMAFLPELGKLPEAASFKPLSKLALPELAEGSELVSEAGEPMGQLLGTENRQIVSLDQISEPMRKTLLAVEDSDFYIHDGVSARSVFRALRANSEAGEVSQGGSTITQQLVKLSLVGNERSIQRKLKEASLALQLEDQMCDGIEKSVCKDKILEQYLNTVYFGRGAYGIQAAARMFFNKSAAELTYADSAVLTSLIRNPNGYDPVKYPKVATERRRVVLLRMEEEGLVNPDEVAMINAAPLPTQTFGRPAATSTQNLSYLERKVRDELVNAPWLAPTEELRRYLIFNGGLKITTTIDPRAQQLAEAAAASNPVKKENPETEAVVVSLDPTSGAVRAIVGEADVPDKGLVETAQPASGRSSGSAFKPFTLVAALESGYSINSSISAAPVPPTPKKSMLPKNRQNEVYPDGCGKGGSMTLSAGLAASNNCVFIRLQAAVGTDKVIDTAAKLGISDQTLSVAREEKPASLTLGGDALVRPIDMAVAYSTIANEGRKNPAHFVSKVQDRSGKVLYEYTPPNEQVITPEVARQATAAMQKVVTGGTGRNASLGRRPVAGKTGTNELEGGENADIWFVGYTPQMTTAVWIGNPAANTSMTSARGSVQGGRFASLVWKAFMEPYMSGLPVASFETPKIPKASNVPDPWSKSGSKSGTSRSPSSSKTASGTTRSTTVPQTTTPATTPGGTRSGPSAGSPAKPTPPGQQKKTAAAPNG